MTMHEGHRQRLRERFRRDGLENFAPHEVLELLLFYTRARGNVNPLAHRLLEVFGSLKGVLEAPAEQLMAVEAEISGDSYQIMMCEIRAFINDLKKDVDGLRRAGVITKAGQFDKDDCLEFIIRIPKVENGLKKRLEKTL